MDDNSFLYKEYEECFKQLRFYDSRQSKLVGFILTISSTYATILITLYKLLNQNMHIFYMLVSIVSSIIFIAILLTMLGMIQNRIYFSFVAKQINAIRKYMLENSVNKFKDNQMYLSTSFPVFKFFSIQTLMIFGVANISSLFFGGALYATSKLLNISISYKLLIFFCFILLLIELTFMFFYLYKKGSKNADIAIHGKNNFTENM